MCSQLLMTYYAANFTIKNGASSKRERERDREVRGVIEWSISASRCAIPRLHYGHMRGVSRAFCVRPVMKNDLGFDIKGAVSHEKCLSLICQRNEYIFNVY